MYPFKNILFATDFSPLSRSMLKYAAAFARHCNARLYLHNAQEATVPPQALRLSERALSEHGFDWLIAVRQELEELAGHELVKGLDVHMLLTEGRPEDEIVRVAKDHDIDLVLMGTERRGQLERVLLGSTFQSVLERINCPVFTGRQQAHDFVYYRGSETTVALNRILFATDFSPYDAAAKTLTMRLAEAFGAKVTVLHALGVFLGYLQSVSMSDTGDIEGRVRRDATENLSKIKAEFDALNVATVLGEGRTSEEILRVAKELDVDLIVVGVGSRHSGNVLGRNTERVIRAAHCPVLVAPA